MSAGPRGRVVAWAALLTGIAASVAANVGHARPDLGPRLLSALAPVALGLVVEVLARVSWQSGRRSVLPRLATVLVGAVAAVASYSHLHGLALRYGESGLVAALLPLSVDGLAAVGALAVVEIGRTNRAEVEPTRDQVVIPAPPVEPTNVDPPVEPFADVDEPADERPPVDEQPDEPADELVLLARAVAADLHRRGRRLSRDELARGIRGRGQTVSSARASELLRQLKAA